MPLVSRTFDQLINFTRTSSATFVGSNGLIQTTPQSVNLLTYTQEFDNGAWNKASGSVIVTTNSTTAPDGTSTADTITESVGNTTHNIYQAVTVVSGSAYTWSGYVKANGRSIVQVNCQATATIYTVEFDLTAVTTTNRSGTGSATITAVGDGWYRITATATSTGAGTGYWQINLCSAANTPSYAGNGTSGIFLWGAQLQTGSTATTYTRNFGGLFPPRFDYDPVTLAPRGLLMEEQRTNLFLYSDQFNNSAWTLDAATITANTTVSPDGSTNADSLVEDTSTGIHGVYQTPILSAATHTLSVYVKAVGRSWVSMFAFQSGGNPNYTWFNLATGTVGVVSSGTISASITPAGGGWYRCTLTFAALAAPASVYIHPALADGGGAYLGNGATALALYGAQLEAGTFATSYIPTVASQVTRSIDTAVISAPNFAPWYNQSEGTFVIVSRSYVDVTQDVMAVDNGLAATSTTVYKVADFYVNYTLVGGVPEASTQVTVASAIATNKVAAAYRTNDFTIAANGVLGTADTSGNVPSVNRLIIAPAYNSSQSKAFWFASITFYPTRLTNAQLQALTT